MVKGVSMPYIAAVAVRVGLGRAGLDASPGGEPAQMETLDLVSSTRCQLQSSGKPQGSGRALGRHVCLPGSPQLEGIINI